MVRAQRPDANAATVTTGGVGGCYAEFGMTSRNNNNIWESAYLDTNAAPKLAEVSNANIHIKTFPFS